MAQLREFVRSARLVAELHAERTNFTRAFSFFLSSNGVHERSFVFAVRAFHSRRGPFSFEVRAGPRRLRSFEFEAHEIRANFKGWEELLRTWKVKEGQVVPTRTSRILERTYDGRNSSLLARRPRFFSEHGT